MKYLVYIFLIIGTAISSQAQTNLGLGFAFDIPISTPEKLFNDTSPAFEIKVQQKIYKDFYLNGDFSGVFPYLIPYTEVARVLNEDVKESTLTNKLFRSELTLQYKLKKDTEKPHTIYTFGFHAGVYHQKLKGKAILQNFTHYGDEKYQHSIAFGPELGAEFPLNKNFFLYLNSKYSYNPTNEYTLHWLQLSGGILYRIQSL